MGTLLHSLLINQEFLLEDGSLGGANIGEAMVPSTFGLTLETICTDGRESVVVEQKQ